ncbi:MAG: hypothetical protein K6A80_06125 [Saccharofermentans sp.]|nr:hypothetical protein [Saccharofermentans sp.]
MEKSYKGKIIGMIIPAALSFIIITVCTIMQQRIINQVGHFIVRNPQYRKIFQGQITGKNIVPFYMYFCSAAAIITIILIINIVSKKKWKTNPGALIAPILTYSIPVVIGIIYNNLGGDKLIYGSSFGANVDILTTVISLLVSPVMVVFFIFFLITMISLYDNAKKNKASHKQD